MLAILFIHWAINGLAQFSHMTHVPCELGGKNALVFKSSFSYCDPENMSG